MEPDAAGACAGDDFPADCESDFLSVWPDDFAPELFCGAAADALRIGRTNEIATTIAAASARPERLIVGIRDRIRLLPLCRDKRILLVAFSRKKGFFFR